MQALLWLLCAVTAQLALVACGSDNTFRINGKIENYGTGNLRVVYYTNGAVQSVVAPAIDGKFSMTGRVERPVLARIYTGNGAVVGRFVVKPGETVEAVFDITDPSVMKFDGNDDSKRFSKFIGENADLLKNRDTAGLNAAIEKYVRDNTGRLAAGVLMADYFDMKGNEQLGTELINLLDDNVVAATSLQGLAELARTLATPTDSMLIEPFTIYGTADSLIEINPQSRPLTLLMFTDASSRRADSVTSALAALLPLAKNGRIQIADISCDTDTASWHASIKEPSPSDSIKSRIDKEVKRFWSPAPFNIMGFEEVPVAEVPWFIVADSTRHVLYCGPAVSGARNAVK